MNGRTITASSNLNTGASTTRSGNRITISDPVLSTYVGGLNGGGVISVTIDGGENPVSARDAGTFKITTKNLSSGTYYIVDEGKFTNIFIPDLGTLSADTASSGSTTGISVQSTTTGKNN